MTIKIEIINNCLIRFSRWIIKKNRYGDELIIEFIKQLRFPTLYLKPIELFKKLEILFYTSGFCSRSRGRHLKIGKNL